MTPALRKTYPAPPVDVREVLRYARSSERDEVTAALLPEAIAEAAPHLTYRVAYRETAVVTEGDCLKLCGLTVRSRLLSERLFGCHRALIFAATVGTALDRLIARYTRLSPSRALLLGAVGSERVEALCDLFCADATVTRGRRPTARLSPGYGDLPLTLQREVLALLDAERFLGITLSPSLLMAPSKSVTAFVGIPD